MVAEFVENLSEFASQNLLDPIIGREEEIHWMIEALCRAKRCHPILIGRSGAGLSSITKGLARHALKANLPARLKGLSIRRINFDLLFANSTTLTDTLNHLLETIYDAQDHVVLILDSLSSLLQVNVDTCQQILTWVKRIFASYEIRVVLVCDQTFYDQFLKSDAYLLEHCVPIFVNEPTIEKATDMIKTHLPKLQSVYQIKIPEMVVCYAAQWAKQYLADKPLPSAAIDLLDAAAAGVCARQDTEILSQKHLAIVVNEWKAIPIDFLLKTEAEKINYFVTELSREICGQFQALQAIEQTVQSLWSGLIDETTSLANFLFAGPKNVGKTTMAECIAKLFYGTQSHLIRFNMNDYQQEADISKLLGAFNLIDGKSYLISELNRCPFSVCLFENIDLAHPKLMHLLLNMIALRKIEQYDLSHHIIIMTVNLNDVTLHQEVVAEKQDTDLLQLVLNDMPGTGARIDAPHESLEIMLDRLEPALTKKFDEEFLQAFTVVPFTHLTYSDLISYARKQLNQLAIQLSAREGITLQYSNHLARECLDLLPQSMQTVSRVKQLFAKRILPVVSQALLNQKLQQKKVEQLTIFVDNCGQLICQPMEALVEESV